MKHIPVLLHETVSGLSIEDGDIVVDMTLGSGGHSKAICDLGKKITILGIDADQDAIERAKTNLATCTSKCIFESTFNYSLETVLEKHSIPKVNKVLFDLGMSSPQIDDSYRGFSFKRDEPLLMTMKRDIGADDLTAYEIVNTWAEESLADIIFGYGDERYARRIARAIVTYRKDSKIKTTNELVEVIKSAVPSFYKNKKIHPATKTFQAIRIAVNDEIEGHKRALLQAWNHLEEGGRIAVITFHSLEDRVVKHFFKKLETEEGAKRVTKKPIVPSEQEVKENPRSRSAKLRIIEKPIQK